MKIRHFIVSSRILLAAYALTPNDAIAGQDQFLAIYPVFTYWGADDACTYDFVLDGTGGNTAEPMSKVTVQMIGKDEAGKPLANLVLQIPLIGGSEADRYKKATVEGPCSITRLSINAALATIDGKSVDLLKASVISPAPPSPPLKVSVQSGNPNGHMAMWNGTQWVSDFRQGHGTNPYPSAGYRSARPSLTYYRP